MKTTLKVLSVIIKIILIIFAIIGVIYTAVLAIMAKPAVNHVYDVIDEYDGSLYPDEDQDRNITAEAFSRTMADPRVKDNRFINAVSYGVGKFASFVANI